MTAAPVGAIVTAYRRASDTLRTLESIKACVPPPAEVIVHVDGGADSLAEAIRVAFPDVRVLLSRTNVGPGGARNLLVEAISQPLIASFDDDSFPMDPDFFLRLGKLFGCFPEAWVIAARVFHLNEPNEAARPVAHWAADFSGGGCAYRRDRYLEAGGYVPLPTAYNMEEVDLALRLHAKGGRVLATPWLRVFHDTDLARHADPGVTAASIANLALLAFLRYPVHLWTIGVFQCANRIQWLLRNGRSRGVLTGLADIPGLLWRHRRQRRALSAAAVKSYFALRRHPVSVPLDAAIARVSG